MPDKFFAAGGMEEFLPVGNGILRVNDRKLLRFSPKFHYRNKLAVDFISGAKCPTFETVLLGGALDADDIGLLQRWSGLSLISRNISQAILILSGTAGAGRGTFVRVLERVIGEANVASLRTAQLSQRFEIGRFVGNTLLYGADVPANFLSSETYSQSLKSLTGGYLLTAEMKGSMTQLKLKGEFNVIVVSNSRLTVHLGKAMFPPGNAV